MGEHTAAIERALLGLRVGRRISSGEGINLIGMMFAGADLGGLRGQLMLYAGAALLVLLTATGLSMYKPRGRTRYGAHKLARVKPMMTLVESLPSGEAQ